MTKTHMITTKRMAKQYLNIILTTLLILLFIQTNTSAADKGNKKISIKWKVVQNAFGYKVTLKNNKDKIIITETTKKNQMEFRLPEGNYKMRIGAMNRFKDVEAWADWVDLKVVIKDPPEAPLEVEYEKKVSSDGKKMSVKIKWKPPRKNNKKVKGYLIFKIDKNKYIKVAQTEKTEYTIHNLQPRKGYKFEVFSANKDGEESRKSIKIFVNKSKWIKENMPFYISFSYNNLVPVGDFHKLFLYGAGVRINISVKRFFRYNFRLGIDTGFWYLFKNSDVVDKSLFFPICLAFHYRFIFHKKFSVEPGISAGGTYNYLVSSKDDVKLNEHLYKAIIGASTLFSYQFNEKINIELGAEFMVMFEGKQPMYLLAFHLGAGFRL